MSKNIKRASIALCLVGLFLLTFYKSVSMGYFEEQYSWIVHFPKKNVAKEQQINYVRDTYLNAKYINTTIEGRGMQPSIEIVSEFEDIKGGFIFKVSTNLKTNKTNDNYYLAKAIKIGQDKITDIFDTDALNVLVIPNSEIQSEKDIKYDLSNMEVYLTFEYEDINISDKGFLIFNEAIISALKEQGLEFKRIKINLSKDGFESFRSLNINNYNHDKSIKHNVENGVKYNLQEKKHG